MRARRRAWPGSCAVNYPRGRIFLGDGGAYLVGLVLAVLSVLLVHRNSGVSPWFPLVLLAYPIWETLFSMYRRKARGHSTGRADALHLHSLVYRRVVRWRGFAGKPSDYVTRNSIASPGSVDRPGDLLCRRLGVLGPVPARSNSRPSRLVFFTRWRYLRLVRFRVPAWLVIRGAARPLAETDSEPAEAGPRR